MTVKFHAIKYTTKFMV